jgi:E3 ubiquitin-protein ligase ATL6/9/15/31/42/55
MLRTLDNGSLSLPAAITARSAAAPQLVPAVGPASPHAVRALEVLSGQGLPELGPADSCTICLEPMQGCAQLLRMPCSLAHTYHRACLTRWLQTSSSCPLCRERLVE